MMTNFFYLRTPSDRESDMRQQNFAELTHGYFVPPHSSLHPIPYTYDTTHSVTHSLTPLCMMYMIDVMCWCDDDKMTSPRAGGYHSCLPSLRGVKSRVIAMMDIEAFV